MRRRPGRVERSEDIVCGRCSAGIRACSIADPDAVGRVPLQALEVEADRAHAIRVGLQHDPAVYAARPHLGGPCPLERDRARRRDVDREEGRERDHDCDGVAPGRSHWVLSCRSRWAGSQRRPRTARVMAVGYRDKGPETILGDRGHQSARNLERPRVAGRIHAHPGGASMPSWHDARIRSGRCLTSVVSSADGREPVVRLGEERHDDVPERARHSG